MGLTGSEEDMRGVEGFHVDGNNVKIALTYETPKGGKKKQYFLVSE